MTSAGGLGGITGLGRLDSDVGGDVGERGDVMPADLAGTLGLVIILRAASGRMGAGLVGTSGCCGGGSAFSGATVALARGGGALSGATVALASGDIAGLALNDG